MMRNIFLILLLASCLFVSGQTIAYPFHSAREVAIVPVPSDTLVDEDFQTGYTPTSIALGDHADWVNVGGELKVEVTGADSVVNPSGGSGIISSCYYIVVVGDDYRVVVYMTTLDAFNGMGPSGRASTTTESYYLWWGTTSSSRLIRMNSGVETLLATGGAWSPNTRYSLEFEGDLIRCYEDDALDTSIDGDGIYDDSGSASRLQTGEPAIGGRGNDNDPDATRILIIEL